MQNVGLRTAFIVACMQFVTHSTHCVDRADCFFSMFYGLTVRWFGIKDACQRVVIMLTELCKHR